MRKTFAIRTEPHVAEIGDNVELLFQPEVMGDEFLDAYERLKETQRGLGVEVDDLANVDPDRLRQTVGALRVFLAQLMLPESAERFARWNVALGGEIVATFGDPEFAHRHAADLEGATVVDAGLRLPDRVLVELLEWTVELYGGRRPPTSSNGSAPASPFVSAQRRLRSQFANVGRRYRARSRRQSCRYCAEMPVRCLMAVVAKFRKMYCPSVPASGFDEPAPLDPAGRPLLPGSVDRLTEEVGGPLALVVGVEPFHLLRMLRAAAASETPLHPIASDMPLLVSKRGYVRHVCKLAQICSRFAPTSGPGAASERPKPLVRGLGVRVPGAGLEPARPEGQRVLSSPCLLSTIRAQIPSRAGRTGAPCRLTSLSGRFGRTAVPQADVV